MTAHFESQYVVRVVSTSQHGAAVERLQASYAALGTEHPIRLAKPTTNLFRPRQAVAVPGLDVSGLTGVLAVDPVALTADVQGMCTYEDIVAATLPHGLMPYVVPQLRTITLGGAVSGLGIEATSFRSGLPHESVVEMDVFTGAGEVVTTRPGEDLFDTFPNSYGSLGYATRLRIELEEVPPYVALRHVRYDDAGLLAKAIEAIMETREHDGQRVDAMDGVAFEPGEYYLTLARWTDEPGPTSDYAGQRIYYRSVRELAAKGTGADRLTILDYLWRWDTDWFWCSGAFGAQHRVLRRLWPRRWRRSDVYMRMLGWDRRFGIADRLDRRAGRPQRERVIQDVEVPADRLAHFLQWFDGHVGMRPVWLCPLRLRETRGAGSARTWPSYPLEPGTTYVNAGFWGTVPIEPGRSDGDLNRAIEAKVAELGGHKSLYSDAYYDRETFDALYDTANLDAVRRR